MIETLFAERRSTGTVTLAILGIVLVSPSPASAQRSYGPGVCGPIDPVYVRTANETGGQPFPMAPSEIAAAGTIISESSRSDASMLMWAHGTTADGNAGLAVPIDASVSRVTFAITFDGKGGGAEIVRPDGAIVQAGATAGDAVLNCGRILSVDAPAPGIWQVRPAPTARFWMVVYGRSARDILSAEFVRPGGRPGHEGLFRIHGMPIAGRPAMLRVRLDEADVRTPSFLLLSVQGLTIQRLSLERLDDDEFVGEITLPSVPFRVAVAGTDAAGTAYQRIHKSLFRAESIEVVAGATDSVKSGEDTPLTFVVRNHGARARYRVVATAGAEILKRVEPAVVDLDANSEQPVTVWLPAATVDAAGASLELLVVASRDDPALSSGNSVIQRLSVRRR